MGDNGVFDRFKGKDGGRRTCEALIDQKLVHGNTAIAKALCLKSTLRCHEAGDVIVTCGDGRNDIYFILAGSVTVLHGNREIAQRVAGESIGEMAVIDVKSARCASVVARDKCVLASVKESDFTRIACRYPILWRSLAKEIADRFRKSLVEVRPRNISPRVFIGSSGESQKAASAVKKALDGVAEAVVWTQGNVFEPGKFTLESLEDQARCSDFAVMVFAPDDVIFSRGKSHAGPRDNVIFELGLFMGALDRKRAFILAPRGRKLKIPTDILGTNYVSYASGGGKPLEQNIANACEKIRNVVVKIGPL